MAESRMGFAQQMIMARIYNNYVPAMNGLAAGFYGDEFLADLGTPVVADDNGILNDAADATTFILGDATNPLLSVSGFDTNGMLDAKFGRNLTVVASTTCTSVCTFTGWDYLGQPMKEAITANGTNAVAGLKAFKWLYSVAIAEGGSATLDIGFGDVLGLPYKCSEVTTEWADGVKTASLGTFAAPVLTDPATATTGDPRGTYDPNTTLNGTKRIVVNLRLNRYVNASGNGGLHGIQHYFA